MNRTLVITIELEETENDFEYAMDSLNTALGYACAASEFVKAEYNGELMMDRDGNAAEWARASKFYDFIMEKIEQDKY